MRIALALLTGFLLATSGRGQGTINLAPVPVTNGLTGTLADTSFVAALYFGPAGTPEGNLLMLGTPMTLVGGYAQFGDNLLIPVLPSGASAEFQVRAWSAGFPDYASAVGSGLGSVLAGTSVLLMATLGGGGPPPVPNPLAFPGFTIYPVPEPAGIVLGGLGALLFWVKLRLAQRAHSGCSINA